MVSAAVAHPQLLMKSLKIKEYLKTIEHTYPDQDNPVPSKYLYTALQEHTALHDIKPEEIPEGKGKRRTPEQRLYIKGKEYLLKLLEYEEKETICGGDRNSFYKTDRDAIDLICMPHIMSRLMYLPA